MEGDDEPSTYLVGSIEERGTGYDVISPGCPLGKPSSPRARRHGDLRGASRKVNVEILAVRPPD
ncbi:MAG: hypothetical protein ACRDYF_08410 [Acidimicrobiia bacterium]